MKAAIPLNIPFSPESLARVDQLDQMITKLKAGLATLNRSERGACEKTMAALQHKIIEECEAATMRYDIRLRGEPGSRPYKVKRDDDGAIKAIVWDPCGSD